MIRAQAGQSIGAQMVNATTGGAFAGVVTVYITIDAGVQAIGTVGAGLCTAEGNGYYTYLPSLAETDGSLIGFTFIGTGAIPATIQVATITTTQTAALTASTGAGVFTGLSLITKAFKTIQVLAVEETPSAADAQDALGSLNDLLDAFGTQDLTIYQLLRTLKTLAAGTGGYTIGTGGAINIVRPTEIVAAGLILDMTATTPLETTIDVLTDQQWEAIPQKSYSATYPSSIYYDHGWTSGLGLVYPFPIPNQALSQLVLYTEQALVGMTLAGAVSFPPGYARMLRYALARELSSEFGGWDERKETIYQDAMRNVKDKNLRMSELALPVQLMGRPRSNIYTGQA